MVRSTPERWSTPSTWRPWSPATSSMRERVIIRKRRVVEEHLVEADLRRERLEVEADQSVAERLRNGVPTEG